jgi:methylated-DNA-protein-cysteine methyltransferase related protein
MPTSPEFAARVYAVVARIPHGRVTSYGRIARALGEPRAARMVGWALMHVPAELDLPCHRVVNRVGLLTGGWHFGHPDVMRGLLRAERVPFVDEYQVDLAACLWLPWEDEDSTAADGVDDLDPIAGGQER